MGDVAAGAASDALASVLAEQAADAAEARLRALAAAEGMYLTGRYSPGYGDWPIGVQPRIAALLDTPRRIGLCVTGTCLMLPRKSITAALGLSRTPVTGRRAGCAHCALRTSANTEREARPVRAEELFRTRETVLLDGAMGTMLQAAGLPLGARPEALNLEDPALIESIHARYAAAGSRIPLRQHLRASAHKLAGSGYTVEQVVDAAIRCAPPAAQPYGSLVALDIGPLGELLEPAGTLPFEERWRLLPRSSGRGRRPGPT